MSFEEFNENGAWDTFLRKRDDVKRVPGVSGVALANPDVLVYVKKATPEVFRGLPEEVDGIPVAVREIGSLYILPFYTLETFQQSRVGEYIPVPGGVSVGTWREVTGTHGCTVIDNGSEELLGVGCNHVVGLQWGTNYEGVVGDAILQPGPYDSPSPRQIGELLRVEPVPPIGMGAATVDAAVYTVDEADPRVLGFNAAPGPSVFMQPGMKVAKSGRTTGVTTGYVEAIGGVFDIEGYGEAKFEDCAITDRGMSRGGDSGSLVVNAMNESCGLVFAGNENATVICEAKNVEAELDVSFEQAPAQALDFSVMEAKPFLWPSILVGGMILYYAHR